MRRNPRNKKRERERERKGERERKKVKKIKKIGKLRIHLEFAFAYCCFEAEENMKELLKYLIGGPQISLFYFPSPIPLYCPG